MTDDDALVQRLRDLAAQVDAPPELVVEQARAAFLLRDLDAELAELVSDSAVDAGLAVRGPGYDVRILSFRSAGVLVRLQLTRDGHRNSLLGMVEGATEVVELETPRGQVRLTADDMGRFTVEDIAAVRFRLHLARVDGRPVTTSWVSV